MTTLEDILALARSRQPVIMGVVNVTPDSFSDGGRFLHVDEAIAHVTELVAEGADILDLGAESTRPGSEPVSPAEQIDRLRQVLPAAVSTGVVVSVDTTSSEVAAFALDVGAAIVNDVSAGRFDPDLLPLVAARGAGLCLMHMQGMPKTMQVEPAYDDVVAEVREFLADRIAAAQAAGVERDRIIVDPGIGFGKTLAHNLSLLAGMDQFASLGCPVLLGVSRKRFIGELSGEAIADRRDPGTVAACLACYPAATIFRVHDVAAIRQAFAVFRAIAGRATS
jgi:dihydropteroate synthase